jgi:hypothetical protein
MEAQFRYESQWQDPWQYAKMEYVGVHGTMGPGINNKHFLVNTNADPNAKPPVPSVMGVNYVTGVLTPEKFQSGPKAGQPKTWDDVKKDFNNPVRWKIHDPPAPRKPSSSGAFCKAPPKPGTMCGDTAALKKACDCEPAP